MIRHDAVSKKPKFLSHGACRNVARILAFNLFIFSTELNITSLLTFLNHLIVSSIQKDKLYFASGIAHPAAITFNKKSDHECDHFQKRL